MDISVSKLDLHVLLVTCGVCKTNLFAVDSERDAKHLTLVTLSV